VRLAFGRKIFPMFVHEDQWVNAARFDVECRLWARRIVNKYPTLQFHEVLSCLRDEMCDDLIWKVLDQEVMSIRNKWERYWYTKHLMTRKMIEAYDIEFE